MNKKLEEVFECLKVLEDCASVCGDYSHKVEPIKQALLELQSIKESNPGEAMELVYWLKDFLRNMTPYYDWVNDIEKYILKAQENEKVLEIIKEKGVDVGYLKTCKTLEEYNYNCWNDEEDFNKKLTDDEFDKLKR